ncbi:MAG: DNA translocase FtsK 4TM domain-containing protein [Clostridium sp.]
MSRKKTQNNRNTKNKKAPENNKDIQGVIFIAVGILLTIAIYTNFIGILSTMAQNIGNRLLGVGTYFIPPYLLYLGFNFVKCKGEIKLSKRFYGVSFVVMVVILIFGTIHMQVLENIAVTKRVNVDFFNELTNIAMGESNPHAGVIGFLITFPLFKLLGNLGSYILYVTICAISFIMIFNITLYDLGIKVKSKGREINEKRKVSKVAKKEEYINIINKEEPYEEKDEFLAGVSNKIKILDFMKNATIEEGLEISNEEKNIETPAVEQEEITTFIESFDEKKNEPKSTKLRSEEKEVVNKEIEEQIKEEKEEKIYIYPDTSLLNVNASTKLKSTDKKELIENANKLEETLASFGVVAKVNQVSKGPSVTRFELQPSPGVKVSKIVNLSDDIALGLAAKGVRIEAPIPGKAAIGIEVPNLKQTPVYLKEVLDSKEFQNTDKKLGFALGKDIAGKCIVGDLSKMPHTLIAGATGSGKSVCINTLIISILYKYSPDDVKFLMVDPKVVELNVYNGIPHLLIPVVTDPKKAAAALNWAVNEMTKRYNTFAEMGVRNIDSYNKMYEKGIVNEKMPYIVIIVDELADLMMACPNDVEDYICRLTQMARAAGMHLVIATQRPSVDVITGVIKANIPSRISFAVSSQIDSRTILDSAGAEKLLGKGDMLYHPTGESKAIRIQGCFISEEEVEKVVGFIKEDDKNNMYKDEIIQHINNTTDEAAKNSDSEDDGDELLQKAIELVVDYEQASTSFLQRRLRVGFNRAARIMEQLEERGVISPKDGSRPRQVLVKKEDLVAAENYSEE